MYFQEIKLYIFFVSVLELLHMEIIKLELLEEVDNYICELNIYN
jgi:hypothetical protein